MSKRTPDPEPYFTVSTKPMLAWGALLITSQLTVAEKWQWGQVFHLLTVRCGRRAARPLATMRLIEL